MKNIITFLVMMAISVSVFSQSKNYERDETDVAAKFKELITIENLGDSLAVRKMVWQSPDLLFIATGKADVNGYVGFGTNDAMKHFELLYGAHIHISPVWNQQKISFLSKDVARIFVPVALSFPNSPTSTPFYLVTEWIRQGKEWKLASHIGFPVPPKTN